MSFAVGCAHIKYADPSTTPPGGGGVARCSRLQKRLGYKTTVSTVPAVTERGCNVVKLLFENLTKNVE